MNSIYAIAYMTENEDGVRDLYVETLGAGSEAEAVGMSMLEYMGAEITGRGEKIVMVNVAAHDPEDTAAMVAENQQEAPHG